MSSAFVHMQVNELRSIDNYHVVVKELPEFCKDEVIILLCMYAHKFS